jgi:hypothetical protein
MRADGYDWIFTLNGDGYVINLNISGTGQGCDYEYQDGYLVRENLGGGSEVIYTWENENLKSTQNFWDGEEERIAMYSYNSVLNKEVNIMPWATPMIDDPGYLTLVPSKWFGKKSKHLMSSVNNEYNYRYETNAGGYVSKVYLKEGNDTEFLLFDVQYK